MRAIDPSSRLVVVSRDRSIDRCARSRTRGAETTMDAMGRVRGSRARVRDRGLATTTTTTTTCVDV